MALMAMAGFSGFAVALRKGRGGDMLPATFWAGIFAALVSAVMAGVGEPTLLVHGTGDESVEHESLDILAAARGEGATLLSVEGAGHTFGIKHPMTETDPAFEEVWAHTCAFLDEHLGTTA